jgi:hypothetical protein
VVLILTSYPEVDSAWVAALKTSEEPVIVVDAANCVEESAVAGKGAVYRAIGLPRRSTSPRERLTLQASVAGGASLSHPSAGLTPHVRGMESPPSNEG